MITKEKLKDEERNLMSAISMSKNALKEPYQLAKRNTGQPFVGVFETSSSKPNFNFRQKKTARILIEAVFFIKNRIFIE